MTKQLLQMRGPLPDADSLWFDDSNGQIGTYDQRTDTFTAVFAPASTAALTSLALPLAAAATAPLASSTAGYIPVKQIIRANATRTFTSDTNLQAIFTTPAGGALSVGVGTYLFEGLLKVNTLHADAGNFLLDMKGAGSATAAAWLWTVLGLDATDPTAAAAASAAFAVTEATGAAAVVAGTGTGAGVLIKGTFEISAAGTLIPSLDQLTASAAVVEVGSYILFEKISTSEAVTAIGAFA